MSKCLIQCERFPSQHSSSDGILRLMVSQTLGWPQSWSSWICRLWLPSAQAPWCAHSPLLKCKWVPPCIPHTTHMPSQLLATLPPHRRKRPLTQDTSNPWPCQAGSLKMRLAAMALCKDKLAHASCPRFSSRISYKSVLQDSQIPD